MYTQEQLDIALLKQKDDSFHHLLTEIKNDVRELRNYTIGFYVFGLTSLLALVCKAFGWF